MYLLLLMLLWAGSLCRSEEMKPALGPIIWPPKLASFLNVWYLSFAERFPAQRRNQDN